MNVRKVRCGLWIGCGGCLAAAALSVALAVATPLDIPQGQIPAKPVQLSLAGKQMANSTPAAGLTPLSNLKLQRPLFDPPPAPAPVAPPPPPPPPLNLKLTGTILDGSKSVGIFLLPGGEVQMKGVGEEVGGASVLKIELNSATVSYRGQTLTISIPKEGPG